MHNNYLTLPVVFLMIANHYPLLFATRYNWLIVAIVLLIGPVIRHFYKCATRASGSPVDLGRRRRRLIAIAWLTVDRRPLDQDRRLSTPIVQSRAGHRALPLQHVPRRRAGLGRHHRAATRTSCSTTPTRSRRHGRLIEIRAVQSRAMPPGNITEMTDQERSTLAAWRAQEAPSWLHCPSFLCGSDQP